MLALYIVCIVAGALLILYLSGCVAVAFKMFKPKKRTDDMLIEYETAEKHFDKKWLEIPCEHLAMDSDFGYKLHGRLYMNEKPSDKFILSLHGHNSSGIGQLKYLNIFLDMGYNVFIPDHRRSGKSEGSSITFGAYEKRDVRAWINLLSKRFPNATFALFGESMGAATAIMVTASDARIRFLVEYCGFASIDDLVASLVRSRVLAKLILPGLQLVAGAFFDIDFKDCAAKDSMKNITVPVLMLHSRADKLVPFQNAEILHKANPRAEFVTFEDSRHARSWVKYPDKYTAAVKDFIARQDAPKA